MIHEVIWSLIQILGPNVHISKELCNFFFKQSFAFICHVHSRFSWLYSMYDVDWCSSIKLIHTLLRVCTCDNQFTQFEPCNGIFIPLSRSATLPPNMCKTPQPMVVLTIFPNSGTHGNPPPRLLNMGPAENRPSQKESSSSNIFQPLIFRDPRLHDISM